MRLTALLLQPPSSPIIVRVLEPEDRTAFDFADVLVQALGLTGALLAGSVVLGALIGGFFIGLRMRRARSVSDGVFSNPLSITSPPSLKN